jgi:hypothetical protein
VGAGTVGLCLALVGFLHLTRGTAARHVRGVAADGVPIAVTEPEFPLVVTMMTGTWMALGNRVEVMLNGDGTMAVSPSNPSIDTPSRPEPLARAWHCDRQPHRWPGGFGIDDKWLGDGRSNGSWRETNVQFEGPAVRQLKPHSQPHGWKRPACCSRAVRRSRGSRTGHIGRIVVHLTDARQYAGRALLCPVDRPVVARRSTSPMRTFAPEVRCSLGRNSSILRWDTCRRRDHRQPMARFATSTPRHLGDHEFSAGTGRAVDSPLGQAIVSRNALSSRASTS